MENRNVYTITLYRSELMHDIEFESWKVARMHFDTPTLQEKAQVDWEADEWVERQIETELDLLRGKMSWASCVSSFSASDRTGETVSGSTVTMPTQYSFPLALDAEWKGSAKALATSLHMAVVAYVLWRWFLLVKPDAAGTYENQCKEAEKALTNGCRVTSLNMTFRL